MRQFARLKQQYFLSFTFYKTQISYEKFRCVYFLFHWFSIENYMFLFSLHKGRQTSKELKRNINDRSIVFLARFSNVFTYRLNLKNVVSLFFQLYLLNKALLFLKKCFDHNNWNNEKRKQYKHKAVSTLFRSSHQMHSVRKDVLRKFA